MAYEIIITPEQYDNVLKRVFTKGYTTEYYKDSETDIFTGRLGYVYDIDALYIDPPILEIILGDYDFIFVKCYWHAENPELSEIKDFLDKIIEEEIPGLELDPKTASPSKYQDINNCIHTFKYVFPKQKKKRVR
jgi:hypothetical protein